MSAHTEVCGACGASSTFNLPDDHDGSAVAWECPACQARNTVDGWDPAETFLAGPGPRDAVLVTDRDAGSTGEAVVS